MVRPIERVEMSSLVQWSVGRAAAVTYTLVSLLGIAACAESEADPVGPGGGVPEPAINQIVTFGPLNASSTDTLVRFSLATGGLVASTASWDLAFRRYELRLNSPAIAGSASRNVLGYALGNSIATTDAQVLAFTAVGTFGGFDLLRDAAVPSDSLFLSDRLTENRQGYLNLGGVPTANPASYWKVRMSNGAFAVLRATAIAFTPQFQVASLTLESRLQSGSALGAPQTLVIAPAGQITSIHLATNTVVSSPTGCNWDLQFNPSASQLSLTVNAACNAGTYPGAASPSFANVVAAGDAPQYAPVLAQLVGPIPNSVTDKAAPFRYNLTGTGRLHPSFNTYLVRSGTKTYKLQVIDYYSNTGVAGFPTIRYARIR